MRRIVLPNAPPPLPLGAPPRTGPSTLPALPSACLNPVPAPNLLTLATLPGARWILGRAATLLMPGTCMGSILWGPMLLREVKDETGCRGACASEVVRRMADTTSCCTADGPSMSREAGSRPWGWRTTAGCWSPLSADGSRTWCRGTVPGMGSMSCESKLSSGRTSAGSPLPICTLYSTLGGGAMTCTPYPSCSI
jgi:hypothetical protein